MHVSKTEIKMNVSKALTRMHVSKTEIKMHICKGINKNACFKGMFQKQK
jgi:hypothetical protein